MSSNLEQNAAMATINNVGATGSKAITGTEAVTPASGYYFFAIQVITATVVSAQGNVTGATNMTLSSLTTIPAGTILYGKWNSITLTSGICAGYYARA